MSDLVLEAKDRKAPAGEVSGLWFEPDAASRSAGAPTHAFFRGRFTLQDPSRVRIRAVAADYFELLLDGDFFLDGPTRYILEPSARAEWSQRTIALGAGEHVIAIHAVHNSLDTRLYRSSRPFVLAEAIRLDVKEHAAIIWKGQEISPSRAVHQRINPQLGWCEQRDLAHEPEGWHLPDFEDAHWLKPTIVRSPFLRIDEPTIAPVLRTKHTLAPIGKGEFRHAFHDWAHAPSSTRFFERDLGPGGRAPAEGYWVRYDLGRVRLGKLSIEIQAPPGSHIEIGSAESLTHGRVLPSIPYSLGSSCNLDRFVMPDDRPTVVQPLQPRGGRFVEVHVIAPPESVRIGEAVFYERGGLGEPEGSFRCGDPLLEEIWHVGVETLNGCIEDALIDNPTRERGQWTGDVFTVGMDIASVAFSDLRVLKRGLVQAALCANEAGIPACLCPGPGGHFLSMGVQWATACVRYAQLTSDTEFLHEMSPHLSRLVDGVKAVSRDGFLPGTHIESFIDWGYVPSEPNTVDLPLNLHLLESFASAIEWAKLIDHTALLHETRSMHRGLRERITGLIEAQLESGMDVLRWHTRTLAARLGLWDENRIEEALRCDRRHIERCFPNKTNAPRIPDPLGSSPELITPYFMHYSLAEQLRGGHDRFVLDQIRGCWGWMLEGETDVRRTTWLELFDTRWSHCHQWSGCPTWLLSRGGLGLWPAQASSEPRSFLLNLALPSLGGASGRLPSSCGAPIEIEWKTANDRIQWTARSEDAFRVRGSQVDQEAEPRCEHSLTWSLGPAEEHQPSGDD